MAEEDHEQLAAELARETDRLQRESERVAADIEEVRADWVRRQPDGGVPGVAEGESGVASAPGDQPDADPPAPAAGSANE